MNRYEAHHRGQVQFWKIVSIIGGPTVLRIIALLAGLLLWTRRQRGDALLVTAAIGGAAARSGIFKVLVNRSRPVVAVPVEHADSASFPSGHGLISFVAAGVLLVLLLPRLTPRRLRPLLIVAAVLLVLLVGFSRLLLGVHYLSDIVGSWLIGTALLVILAGMFQRRRGSPALAQKMPPSRRHFSRRPERRDCGRYDRGQP